jgi:HNH endonuclease
MTVAASFEYPVSAHQRCHAPAGYLDYENYKPWLRDEFAFRCVYCLERERWYPSRSAAFSVDHVIPQAVAPTRVCDYENLVYACLRCNSGKKDVLLPDPTRLCTMECLSVDEDGAIRALSVDCADLIDLLHLNDSPAIDTWRTYLRIMKLKQDHPDNPDVHALFLDAFGYPDELPDLASRRPQGGNRPTLGPVLSHHDLRKRNQLGDVY